MRTPAPWRVEENRSFNGVMIASSKGKQFATVWGKTSKAETNAILIAAAPELLEACKEVQAVFKQWNEDDDPTTVLEWYSNATAICEKAISKATGGKE